MLDIQGTQRFHGHMCPGLAVGIRAAEIALREIGPHSADEEVVAIVETDMCGVDAIQYLTGCTFGKGNLIHLDYGKNAFTFIRRSDGKALRILTRPNATGAPTRNTAPCSPRSLAAQRPPKKKHAFRNCKISARNTYSIYPNPTCLTCNRSKPASPKRRASSPLYNAPPAAR